MAGKSYLVDTFPDLSDDNKVDSLLFLNGCKAMIDIYGKKTIFLIIQFLNFYI